MALWALIATVYSLVTVFALYMTYQEQRSMAKTSWVFNAMGYIACAAWPIMAAVMLIAVRSQPATAESLD